MTMRNREEKRILDLLRERGYRITTPRASIIRALLSAHGLFSAAHIARKIPQIELSTVYRTLAELEHVGILAAVTRKDGVMSYELSGAHHDHIVCIRCGKMDHVPCSRPKAPKNTAHHFSKIIGHEITWSGVCAACV